MKKKRRKQFVSFKRKYLRYEKLYQKLTAQLIIRRHFSSSEFIPSSLENPLLQFSLKMITQEKISVKNVGQWLTGEIPLMV